MTSSEEYFEPLSDHLDALRQTLIRILLVITAGFVLTLWYSHEIFSLVTWPLKYTHSDETAAPLKKKAIKLQQLENTSGKVIKFVLPKGSQIVRKDPQIVEDQQDTYLIPPGSQLDIQTIQEEEKLTILGPIDGILTTFKVCFWVSVAATAPLWLFFAIQFILPGLKGNEKRLLFPFFALSGMFLVGGLLFAFFVTIPISNGFLWAFNAEMGNNLWTLANYLDFTLFLLLANALAFEISFVLFLFVHIGTITAHWLQEHRRHAIVGCLILSALLTPPDVLSQLLLAFPLIALYEAAILYAKIIVKKRKKQSMHAIQ